MRVVLLNTVWPVILSAVGAALLRIHGIYATKNRSYLHRWERIPASLVAAFIRGLAGFSTRGEAPRSMGATYKERCARDARGN